MNLKIHSFSGVECWVKSRHNSFFWSWGLVGSWCWFLSRNSSASIVWARTWTESEHRSNHWSENI